MSKLLIILLCASFYSAHAFEEIEATPGHLAGWNPANVRNDALVDINKRQP